MPIYIRSRVLLLLFFFSSVAFASESIGLQEYAEGEKLPLFPLDAWTSRQTGPQKDPYFLQNELYHLRLTSSQDLNAPDKKTVMATLLREDQKTVLQSFYVNMKPRGSSSLAFPKKQYSFKVVTADGKKESLEILGMPASDDWILSAPYNDKSLMRDILTYNLSNLMGRYAARTRMVTVSAKIGSSNEVPMGLYVITEKSKKISPHRINIPKSQNHESAYLLEIDRIKDDVFVTTAKGLKVIVAFPDAEDFSTNQSRELTAFLSDIEQRLDAKASPGYRDIFNDRIDLDSAVDFFLIQELSRNVDAYRLSSPMYIPPKGKLYFGPVWDFNLAYGNANYDQAWLTTGWQAKHIGIWFTALMDHPAFCKRLKFKWTALRDSVLSNNSIFQVVDSHVKVMAPAISENFRIWGGLGQYFWPNPYWLAAHDRELDALKSWIALRTEWMDQSINKMVCL